MEKTSTGLLLAPTEVTKKRIMFWLEPLMTSLRSNNLNKEDFWIAGGCLTNVFQTPYSLAITPKDIDVFCKSHFVYKTLVENVKKNVAFQITFEDQNQLKAVTMLRNIAVFREKNGGLGYLPIDNSRGNESDYTFSVKEERLVEINLVAKPYNNPEVCISNFDFACNAIALAYRKDILSLVCHITNIFDAERFNLQIQTISNSKSTLRRLCKKSREGYTISDEQIESLIQQIKALDEKETSMYF